MSKLIYIHYGAKKFDPNLNFPISNWKYPNVKPVGGLWGSRIDAKFGWKQWNEIEDFKICDPRNSFCFELLDESRRVTIRCADDIFKNLPLIKDNRYDNFFHEFYIDFEECLRKGIDAIELDWFRSKHDLSFDDPENLYYSLYGWDCDSIVVLNPNAVMQL